MPRDRCELTIAFDNNTTTNLSAEYLRVFTPSAERTGHGNRQVIGGKAGVTIKDAAPVGRYAIRLVFSDGHDSGIYPLERFWTLHQEQERNWSTYLEELAATGLDRDRPGTAPAPT